MNIGVTTDVLNLRAAPDTTAPIVRVLPRGARLTILETRGEWLRVQAEDGARGFVAAAFVSIEAAGIGGSAPPAQPSLPPAAARTLTPTVPMLNVRSTPAVVNAPDNRVDRAQSGEALVPLEDEASVTAKVGTPAAANQWIRVRTPREIEGFVAAWLLMFMEAAEPAAPPPPPLPPPPPVVPPAQPAPSPATRVLTPTVPTLNVRSAPAVVNDPDNRVDRAQSGETLIPLEDEASVAAKVGTSATDNQWIRARTPRGIEGFVAAWLVTLVEEGGETDLASFLDSITGTPPTPSGYRDFWAQRERLGLPDPFDLLPIQRSIDALRRTPVNGFGPNTFAFFNWEAFYRGVAGMHNGFDWIVPTGTPLLALGDGVIVGTQTDWPFLGNPDDKSVILWPFLPGRDSQGRRLLSNVLVAYGHLSDNAVVRRHDVVRAGQTIGISGRPVGASDNDHLHLEVHLLSGDNRLPRVSTRRLLRDFRRAQPFDNFTPFNPILFFSERVIRYNQQQGQRLGFGSDPTYPSPAMLTGRGLQWPPLDFFSIASYQYGTPPIWNASAPPWPNGIYDLPTLAQRIINYEPFVPYPADFLPA